MADIINLNRVRKRRERQTKDESAARNRVSHGRSAVERQTSADQRRRQEAMLDRHRIGPPDDDPVT